MSVIIVDRLVITWYLLIIVTFSFKGFFRSGLELDLVQV